MPNTPGPRSALSPTSGRGMIGSVNPYRWLLLWPGTCLIGKLFVMSGALIDTGNAPLRSSNLAGDKSQTIGLAPKPARQWANSSSSQNSISLGNLARKHLADAQTALLSQHFWVFTKVAQIRIASHTLIWRN